MPLNKFLNDCLKEVAKCAIEKNMLSTPGWKHAGLKEVVKESKGTEAVADILGMESSKNLG